MTTKQLEKIVHAKPFKPYRLVLSDGEQILMDRPRKSHVSGPVVSLAALVMPSRGSDQVEKLRIIPVEKVVAAEHVDVPVRDR
jgi:hypothetical protein